VMIRHHRLRQAGLAFDKEKIIMWLLPLKIELCIRKNRSGWQATLRVILGN
jgi:hypothetical protein